MFKNLPLFKIRNPGGLSAADLCLKLEARQHSPIGATEQKRIGWVAPRGHSYSPIVESVNGVYVARLMIETKAVPAATVQDAVAKACADIESTTGRKPGKKEKRDLKEEALRSLLPSAFPRRLAVWVAVDPDKEMLLIDSASEAVTDDVASMLVKCVEGLHIEHLQTELAPASMMTSWLADGAKLSSHDRFGFAIMRACELKACDETNATVRYKNHSLDNDEVRQHIAQGKQAVKLALQYNDRVSFALDAHGRLSGVSFEDVVFEGNKDTGEDQFYADVVLTMGEFRPLISDLIEAMGGQTAHKEGGAA